MATDILQQIVATKREELLHMRRPKPSLRQALLDSPTGIIAEFKRRSPSKGWIKQDGQPDQIPLAYQHNGAAALSILTDRQYFGGHDDFIRTARHSGVTLPILYKNFVIDELQLYEALLCGASAVLLIAACLTKQRCAQLMRQAHDLGLEVLLEMHSEPELEYADLGPDLCGINNRNLGSFHTDVETSYRLAQRLRDICATAAPSAAAPSAAAPSAAAPSAATPSTAPCSACGCVTATTPVLVSESGISNPQTVRALRQAGFRGFLIGETFMKASDPGQALADFIKEI